MFSELSQKTAHKKRHSWKPVEEKVLWKSESDRLRDFCLKLKNEGIRKRKFHFVRDWFMVELGLFTGLRVMEMSMLKVKDLIIHGEHSSVIVREGKGSKRRDVWINSGFKKTCFDFLEIREFFGYENSPEEYLFVTNQGTALTTRALEKAFKKCAEKADLSDTYSIHCLRHTYATFSLEAGVDIRFLKEQMGHASIKTTELYLALIQGRNRQALEKLYRTKKVEAALQINYQP